VLWRPLGGVDWFEGIGLNASRTGILFQSDRPADLGQEIELRLALAWETAPGIDLANITCTGRVVRVQTPSNDGHAFTLASTIDRYLFNRPQPV